MKSTYDGDGSFEIYNTDSINKIEDLTKSTMNSEAIQAKIKSIRANGLKLQECINSKPTPFKN